MQAAKPSGKYCFTYCGPENCDCGRSEQDAFNPSGLPEMSEQGDELKRKLLGRYAKKVAPSFGSKPQYINPDGPAAVAFIEQLQTQYAELREGLALFAERLDTLQANCRKLKCGVPGQTNVPTAWLRHARTLLSKGGR